MFQVTEELSALKQNDKGHWLPDSQLIRKQTWETNWFLVSHNSPCIHFLSCHCKLVVYEDVQFPLAASLMDPSSFLDSYGFTA